MALRECKSLGMLAPILVLVPVDASAHKLACAADTCRVSLHAVGSSAPGLTLAAGDAGRTSNDLGAAASDAVRVTNAWVRATPGGVTVAAGYLEISNAGSEPDVLLGGSASFAENIEVHEMSMTNGIMKMRVLPAGLEIPPGETVTLKPGAVHLMLLGLRSDLNEGERIAATLSFKRAGDVEVMFSVAPLGAQGPPASP